MAKKKLESKIRSTSRILNLERDLFLVWAGASSGNCDCGSCDCVFIDKRRSNKVGDVAAVKKA